VVRGARDAAEGARLVGRPKPPQAPEALTEPKNPPIHEGYRIFLSGSERERAMFDQ